VPFALFAFGFLVVFDVFSCLALFFCEPLPYNIPLKSVSNPYKYWLKNIFNYFAKGY
jgi:hypothetical protein